MSSSVLLSSVICNMFVRPTQPGEIFGNVSTPFGTLAIHWHPHNFFSEILSGKLLHWGCKRKSFRVVPHSMTLNGLERRNSPYLLRYFTAVAFGVHYVKVVEDIPILFCGRNVAQRIVLALYHLWRHSRRLSRTSALSVGGRIWAAEYYNITHFEYFQIQLQVWFYHDEIFVNCCVKL